MSKDIFTSKPMAQMKVTCFYGPRNINVAGSSTFHRGIDMGGTAEKLLAVAKGKVIENFYNNARGWCVEIRIRKNITVFYQHMAKKSALKVGSYVESGKIVGYKGNTGLKGMASHLHFEVRVKGEPVDPLPFFIHSFKGMPVVNSITCSNNNANTVWVLEAKTMQAKLKKYKFYTGKVDGKPQEKTKIAIMKFQKSMGLVVDGVFGKKSWQALLKYEKMIAENKAKVKEKK